MPRTAVVAALASVISNCVAYDGVTLGLWSSEAVPVSDWPCRAGTYAYASNFTAAGGDCRVIETEPNCEVGSNHALGSCSSSHQCHGDRTCESNCTQGEPISGGSGVICGSPENFHGDRGGELLSGKRLCPGVCPADYTHNSNCWCKSPTPTSSANYHKSECDKLWTDGCSSRTEMETRSKFKPVHLTDETKIKCQWSGSTCDIYIHDTHVESSINILLEKCGVEVPMCVGEHMCQSGSSTTVCAACPAGRFSSVGNATTCTACPAGRFSSFGNAIQCAACPAGRFSSVTDATMCAVCPVGRFSPVRNATNCTKCEWPSVVQNESNTCSVCPEGSGPDASPLNIATRCIPCPPGQYRSTRDGGTCQKCDWPSVVQNRNTTCSVCPDGLGPDAAPIASRCVRCGCLPGMGPNADASNNDTTGTTCKPCTGAMVYSSVGVCVKCDEGKIAAKEKATGLQKSCQNCPVNKVFLPGYSDSPDHDGECGCAAGFYDASETLIVCFHDGWSDDAVESSFGELCLDDGLTRGQRDLDFNWETEQSMSKRKSQCLKCPPCADCTQRSADGHATGIPVLRDGYIVHRPALSSAALPVANVTGHCRGHRLTRRIHAAFLCEADISVTPSDVSEYGYFTNAMANRRCNCVSASNMSCPSRLPVKLMAGPSAASATKDTCAQGYDGKFCLSCESVKQRYWVPPGSHKTQECQLCKENDYCEVDGVRWCLLSFPFLAIAGAVCFALLRRRRIARAGQVLLSMRSSGSPRSPRPVDVEPTNWSLLGLSSHQLAILRAVLFPPIKILITYAQVTGQLTHVLHVQYPNNFTSMISWTRPILDIWSFFFSADCAGFSSFYSRWLLRVVVQPAFLCVLVWLLYAIEHVGLYSTQRQAKDDRTQNLLRAIFLCYPQMVNVAFSTWNCRLVTNGSEHNSVLIDDDRIFCDDPPLWWFRVFSVALLFVFGLGAPVVFVVRVVRSSMRAERELSTKPIVMKRALKDLVHSSEQSDERREQNIEDQLNAEWQRTWSYELCQREMPPRWERAHRQQLMEQLSKASRDAENDIEAAFIEVTKLSKYSSLTEAYVPTAHYVYWEAIDMLRKYFLVGVVVLAGRGSVAQVVFALVLSFFFFALHLKMWPMKTSEDNLLRASAEIHVFWTIVCAFVVKSDLSHEDKFFRQPFYDWCLVISFVVCIPVAFILNIRSKLSRLQKIYHREADTTMLRAAYLRFAAGVASTADRSQLQRYFETMVNSYQAAEAFEAACDDATGLLPLASQEECGRARDLLRRLDPSMTVDTAESHISAMKDSAGNFAAFGDLLDCLQGWDEPHNLQEPEPELTPASQPEPEPEPEVAREPQQESLLGLSRAASPTLDSPLRFSQTWIGAGLSRSSRSTELDSDLIGSE